MKVFDRFCFTGAKNLKRGKGITAFPIEILYKCSKHMDLVEFVRNMFKKRFFKNFRTTEEGENSQNSGERCS